MNLIKFKTVALVILGIFFIFALFVFSSSSYAQEDENSCDFPEMIHVFASHPIIKSHGHLYELEKCKEPALQALKGEAKQVFYDSLLFNERGLTTYNYQVLLDHLTETEINNLMALFGFEQVGTQLLNSQ